MNDLLHHNQPPDMTGTARETTMDVSAFMAENPVIENEDQAREAKLFIDRGSLCVKDLEDERTNKVRPLNDQVKKINDYYRGPRELLERVTDELKSRVSAFLLGEERKRLKAAAEAARLAEQAERDAREAENKERQAIDEANAGVAGLDIAAFTAEADNSFSYAKKAAHQAALAERETKVKIGGGISKRALSLRNKETIIIENPFEVIRDIETNNPNIILMHEPLLAAIENAAKVYKKVFGSYPKGIRVEIERKA